MGIFQHRNGSADHATFAVWGGHYTSGTGGNTTFIADGLHYSDEVLGQLAEFVKAN